MGLKVFVHNFKGCFTSQNFGSSVPQNKVQGSTFSLSRSREPREDRPGAGTILPKKNAGEAQDVSHDGLKDGMADLICNKSAPSIWIIWHKPEYRVLSEVDRVGGVITPPSTHLQ